MRVDRFYLSGGVQGNTVTVTEPRLLHKWQKVLRAKTGFEMIVFDGFGKEYEARIKDISPKQIRLEITGSREKQPITPALWLYVGLIKKDKFEWVIEKATEIGVIGITPLKADRSEKKNLSLQRAQKIIIEASEQSGRVSLPEITAVKTTRDALSKIDPSNTIVFDRTGEHIKKDSLLRHSTHLSAFVGPEGGWSEGEGKLFQQKNVQSYSLGEQNLKTETAAISASALVLL